MKSRSVRRVLLAVAIGCVAIGAAVAANVALLGLADRPHDRVGRLQLRLAVPAAPRATSAPPPGLVVSVPKPPTADDEKGPDD